MASRTSPAEIPARWAAPAFKYVSYDAIASGTLDANIETRFYIDIGIVHGNAERRKQLCQRNFNCSVNVFPEELLQFQSTDFFNNRFRFRIGNAAVFTIVKIAAIPVPQCLHDIIKRFVIAGTEPDRQIKRKRNKRTLGVIADQRIGCIFILSVYLIQASKLASAMLCLNRPRTRVILLMVLRNLVRKCLLR